MQNDKIKGVNQPRKQPFYKNTDHMTDACAYTDRLGFLVRRKQLKQQRSSLWLSPSQITSFQRIIRNEPWIYFKWF